MSVLIRAMQSHDLDAVMMIQAQAYPPALNEPKQVFADRLQACPNTSWVACTEALGVIGYLFGYRSSLGCVTSLDYAFCDDLDGDCLYLHDLALASTARGQRVSQHLLATAFERAIAFGCEHVSLVSVQATSVFWNKQGFTAADTLNDIESAKLASYSGGAIYMARSLRP